MPPGGHPAKLFINYRREDTAPYAGRLYDRLVAHFGEEHVFIDIDQIDPGEDFVDVINRKVGSCDIAIVSIGPNWLNATDASGNRRLDDEEDFVRMEIVAALERKIRLIPVLVGGARMPQKYDLPEALAPLSRRNAIELSESRFHADVSRLIEAIEKTQLLLEKKKAEPPPVPVAPVTETEPSVRSPDPENLPETPAVRPPAEPPPVPRGLFTETAPPARLPAPENLPTTFTPRSPAGQDQPPKLPPAPRFQAPAATARKSKVPWILGGLGCFSILVIAVVAVIYFTTLGAAFKELSGPGKLLEYNGGKLYYTSSVTEAEAKKLGEYLVKEKFFDGNLKTVQLNKTGTTYEFRVHVKKGVETDDDAIEGAKTFARFISLNLFDGHPVVVHLCDENLKTLRVVTPDQ